MKVVSQTPTLADEYVALIPHPGHPALQVRSIGVRKLGDDPHWLSLRWRVEGASDLCVPPFAGRGRADGLWRTTCFELFVTGGGEAYAEFNFSPSERWAAYDFTATRVGMSERPMPRDPVCTLRGRGDVVLFEAAIPREAILPTPARIGISAVIEEAGGAKSFWALAHPGVEPDFHAAAAFVLQLH